MIDLLYAYLTYYILATVGITFGFHRYFAHRVFKVHPTIEVVMLYCGVLCGGQSALSWSGVHRMHHAYADTKKDPHSPKYNKWWQILFSTWKVNNIPRKFVKDLFKNPRVMFFHKHRYPIYIANAILCFLLFGWIGMYVLGTIFILAYLGFGVLNLFGHDAEGPANKLWVNIIAPFEGNHKDHHEESIP